ncbi:MAG: histidine kinase [Burkholderiales bacterium]|nr:histidine kinase [Burkholderiales bacterium]
MDFNETGPAVATERGDEANPFAVCRMGILWRVIVCVQLPLALGALFGSTSLGMALTRWAEASVVSVPATLLWLLIVCLGAARLGRWPGWMQIAVAFATGCAVAGLALWPSWWIEWTLGETTRSWWAWMPAVLTGGALAVAVTVWLRARASDVVPTNAQARLAELQARIRPHFLFNTLNTAIALVQIDPRRAEAVLEDLAELFREALASPHAQSTLGQEVALAKRYLDIESLRFGERLKVSWQVDESLAATVLPPLVLQPLVENAVRHGVEPCPQGGWVHIEVQPQAGKAVLTISNSVAAQAGTSSALTGGQGMALRNVRQRLHLMYDVEADFMAALQPQGAAQGAAPMFVARVAVPMAGLEWA